VLSAVGEPGVWQGLALSPDNTKVAFNRSIGGNTDIWVYEFARGITTHLTTDPAPDTFPVWNADGSRIAFFSARKQRGIYQRRSDGAGEDELLVKVGQDQCRSSKTHICIESGGYELARTVHVHLRLK
jgi:Tol biopolymer transport system component